MLRTPNVYIVKKERIGLLKNYNDVHYDRLSKNPEKVSILNASLAIIRPHKFYIGIYRKL